MKYKDGSLMQEGKLLFCELLTFVKSLHAANVETTY